MRFEDCDACLRSLFSPEKLNHAPEEWIIRRNGCDEVHRVAYATNLTPAAVRDSVKAGADLLLTHHDAWDFLFGMKNDCLREMEAVRLAHAFFHLPLDDAEFGTNATFLSELGAKETKKTHVEMDMFLCGRVGAFDTPISFEELVGRVEAIQDCRAKAWQNHERSISKICFVAGGGLRTNDVKEAVDNQCDAYITGEKTLYTIEYAQHAGMNLIVGSHTFTEFAGVRSLAERVQTQFPEIDIVPISEGIVE